MSEWNRLIGSSRDFQRRPDPKKVPPKVTNVGVSVDYNVQRDGSTSTDLLVSWVPPTYYGMITCDIWYQVASNNDTGNWQFAGRSRRSPFRVVNEGILPGETYTVAVATVSPFEVTVGPENSAQKQVTLLSEAGPQPPDVAGFSVTDYGPYLLFEWTAVNSDTYPYVMGYEIRAGSTGWSSATFVGKAAPRNTPWFLVPRSKASGTSFYVKAVSFAERYSANPGTATLAAADATSVDAASPGVYYQEITIGAGVQSVTLTTAGQFSSAPFLGVAGSVSGFDGALDGSSLSQNGDGTWSGTFYGYDIGEAGGSTITVLEAGPRQ